MKSILSTNPTFTPGAANTGTLNFSAVNGFNIAGLLAVLNQTRGTLLYATGKLERGYASWNNSTKVLTLKVDTSTHSSGDQLQVIYDAPESASTSVVSLSTWKGSGAFGTVTITTSPTVIKGINYYATSNDSIGSSMWTISNGLSANDILTAYGSAYGYNSLTLPIDGLYCENGVRATAGYWHSAGARLYINYTLV